MNSEINVQSLTPRKHRRNNFAKLKDNGHHQPSLEDKKIIGGSVTESEGDVSLLMMASDTKQNLTEFEHNYETLSDEDGQTKVYFGPFTEKLKLQIIDFETNELKSLKNMNLIQNGLIIEIYQYWTKQKYKIARLCLWIRSLCPHQLNFTDPSLYVKVKNLMKIKHKQIIRTRTKKFAGCYRNFQYGPFFKSENFTEEVIDDTEKEKELRLELKKAEKTINRQMKDIARKDSIIKSLDHHIKKITDDISALREELKTVKREKSLLLKMGITNESLSSDDIKETSKKKKRAGEELSEESEQLKKRSREKASSSIPEAEISSFLSLSPKKEIIIEPEVFGITFPTLENVCNDEIFMPDSLQCNSESSNRLESNSNLRKKSTTVNNNLDMNKNGSNGNQVLNVNRYNSVKGELYAWQTSHCILTHSISVSN